MTRSRRTLVIALLGAVAVAAVVAGVLIAVSSGGAEGSGSAATTTSSTAPSRPSFLVGVPQDGIVLGNPDAPALEEFADPQCPFCAEASKQLLPEIVEQYVKTGKVKLVWRGIAFIGPDSEKGLRAIDAAAAQDRLWDVAERLYARQGAENSGWITDDLLTEVGQGVAGLDVGTWKDDFDAPQTTKVIDEAVTEATNGGVRGTPTFVFRGQQLSLSALDIGAFHQALDPLLR